MIDIKRVIPESVVGRMKCLGKETSTFLVFMMNFQGQISFIKCFIFSCQGAIHVLPVPPWDILSHDFTGYISFISKLQSLSTRTLSTFVDFTLFEVYLLPLSRGVCWFTHGFPQNFCASFCENEVPGRQELHKNELNALLGLDHPHIAPWSCMSPMKLSHIKFTPCLKTRKMGGSNEVWDWKTKKSMEKNYKKMCHWLYSRFGTSFQESSFLRPHPVVNW